MKITTADRFLIPASAPVAFFKRTSAIRTTAILLPLVFACTCAAQTQPAVPKGELTKYTFNQSAIFPGTTRDYWIYIPRQYDPSKPACLYVSQDGISFQAPPVFDSLIAEGKMPITIGVFITPAPTGPVTNLCFAGADLDTLFVASGPHWFSRKLKTHGLSPSEPPMKPKPPKL
jgi:hypothetical protein